MHLSWAASSNLLNLRACMNQFHSNKCSKPKLLASFAHVCTVPSSRWSGSCIFSPFLQKKLSQGWDWMDWSVHLIQATENGHHGHRSGHTAWGISIMCWVLGEAILARRQWLRGTVADDIWQENWELLIFGWFWGFHTLSNLWAILIFTWFRKLCHFQSQLGRTEEE